MPFVERDRKTKPKVLEKENLILCEGSDDLNFLRHILKNLLDKEVENSIQVFEINGKDNLENEISTLPAVEGFDSEQNKLKSISVILDADYNISSSENKIQRAFRKNGFAVPGKAAQPARDREVKYNTITTGYLLFPSCSATLEEGELEDLCLEILDPTLFEATLVQHVENALAPYRESLGKFAKNRLHALFAFTDEFVGKKIGEAARANAFCVTSPKMRDLKEFLTAMVQYEAAK